MTEEDYWQWLDEHEPLLLLARDGGQQQHRGGYVHSHPMAPVSVVLCSALGALCLILNSYVISALVRHRRRVFKKNFYVLVLHCSAVDVLRGASLVAYGMPHLLIGSVSDWRWRVYIFKANQLTLVMLRAANLLTICNLVVFTFNEFVVIRFPLHYRRIFRRRVVVAILAVCWIVSAAAGLLSGMSPSSDAGKQGHSTHNNNNNNQHVYQLSIGGLSIAATILFCYGCLFVVLLCYGLMIRTIRAFHSLELHDPLRSEESHRWPARSDGVQGGSGHSADRRQGNNNNGNGSNLGNPQANGTNNTGGGVDQQQQQQQQLLLLHKNSSTAALGGQGGSARRWRLHLRSRHKYLIVIGSVLLVDVLFLIPYSAIQILALLHLHNVLGIAANSSLIRWGLQMLIGVHAVVQPLCYFRMTEFRRLVGCCGCRSDARARRSKTVTQTCSNAIQLPVVTTPGAASSSATPARNWSSSTDHWATAVSGTRRGGELIALRHTTTNNTESAPSWDDTEPEADDDEDGPIRREADRDEDEDDDDDDDEDELAFVAYVERAASAAAVTAASVDGSSKGAAASTHTVTSRPSASRQHGSQFRRGWKAVVRSAVSSVRRNSPSTQPPRPDSNNNSQNTHATDNRYHSNNNPSSARNSYYSALD